MRLSWQQLQLQPTPSIPAWAHTPKPYMHLHWRSASNLDCPQMPQACSSSRKVWSSKWQLSNQMCTWRYLWGRSPSFAIWRGIRSRRPHWRLYPEWGRSHLNDWFDTLSVASAHALYLIGVVDADDPLRVAGDDAVDEEPDEGSGSDQE